MIEPGVEGEPQSPERCEAFAELGVVAVEVRRRIGVAVVDLVRLVLPRCGIADALEARTGCGHVRAQHVLRGCPERQVDQADDARGDARGAVGAARRHGGDAVDELGLAQRAQRGRTVRAVAGRALDEDRALDFVAAAGVAQQVGEQVAMGREIPQVMVRVDDCQIRLEDRFRRLGQPVLADARHASRDRALRLGCGHFRLLPEGRRCCCRLPIARPRVQGIGRLASGSWRPVALAEQSAYARSP